MIPRGGLCFDGEVLYFDVEEDNLLDEVEEIYMVVLGPHYNKSS